MNDLVKLILSLSLSGSILAGLIFAVKPFIKHRFSQSIQYYVWIVILLRLVLPFSFEGSIMNQVFYGGQTYTANGSQDIDSLENDKNKNIAASSIFSSVRQNAANGVYDGDSDHSRYFRDLFSQCLLYVWLAGAVIMLITSMTGYLRFLKHIRYTNIPARDEGILAVLFDGRYRKVKLARNRFVTTPMLIGIISPVIIIPDMPFSEIQLKSILLHEITHLKRFDIAVKWLTMAAVSIHWFNPLMRVVKKEINHACELSCDEAVIKNLSISEKQAYGETLISIVSESNYPAGVLQATMCEEKRTLKERLVAIMRHSRKSKFIMIISGVLFLSVIFGAVYLGAGAGFAKDGPPRIYISTEDDKTKEALMGSYTWKQGRNVTQADSDNPINFKYQFDNIVSATVNQQLVLGTQKLKIDKKYQFTTEQIIVYKDGEKINMGPVEPSFLNGDLYLQGPSEAGEYIYVLVLNFKDRGTVSYGFVVRVDMLTYNLADIAKYKTPYIGNNSKVSAIASRLPVRYFKQKYISLQTKNRPYGLTVYYEAPWNSEYEGKWPLDRTDADMENNLDKNALVLFCMINNLDEVTFAFRNTQSNGKLNDSDYDSKYTYQRSSFKDRYGDLTELGGNLQKLENILTK